MKGQSVFPRGDKTEVKALTTFKNLKFFKQMKDSILKKEFWAFFWSKSMYGIIMHSFLHMCLLIGTVSQVSNVAHGLH